MKCKYVVNGKCTNKKLKYPPDKCSGRFSNDNKYCYVPSDKL